MGLSSEARTLITTALGLEFTPDGFSVLDDKLTRFMGADGNYIAVSPIRERPGSNAHTLEAQILVQLYGWYDAKIDPAQQVDPGLVEGWADRVRECLKPIGTAAGTDTCWYVRVDDIEFPDDPTGNKTRLEATVRAFGSNNAVV